MGATVVYKNAGRAASPSDTIWADCPVLDWIKSPGKGIYLWEDFVGNFTANDVENVGSEFLLVGTNPDSAVVTDEESVVNISGSAAEHDEAYLVSNLLCNEAISKNSGRRVWFEARCKFDDADADCSFICGLGESSLLTADAIPDAITWSTTALADYDFIGFMAGTDGTNMGGFDSCYHQDGDGGAVTIVQADTKANSGTTNDDTYIKFGFKFDGESTVTFYVDGAACSTTLDIDDLTGDKLDDALGIIIGIKDDVGGADDLKIDWVRFAVDRYSHGHGA